MSMETIQMKKTGIFLTMALVFASFGDFADIKSLVPEDRSFIVIDVNFGEIGWGKNTLTVRAANLGRAPRRLSLTVNTSYLNSGRYAPNQNSIAFDFNPREEKDVTRYFYVRPDHGTLEMRLHIRTETETGLRETIFYKEYSSVFEAPNEKIYQLEFPYPEKVGWETASYPVFRQSAGKHFVFYYFPDSEEERDIENIIAKWEKSFSDLSVEFKAPKPEKIIVFLFPDKRSSERIMFYSGDRLLYHNTIILTDGKNHVPEQNLRSLLRVYPLHANRDSDFWATIGGRGDDGLNNKELRRKVVLCLYEGLKVDQIAEGLELPKNQIDEIIAELENITIVKKVNSEYQPNLLIITREEFQHMLTSINKRSQAVAKLIEEDWQRITRTYDRLSISDIFPIEQTGFHIIGSLVLESGMIDLFFKDGTLLSPYPPRPIKDDPASSTRRRFYCVMIEGREFLKRIYGLSDRGYVNAPQIISYGRYADNQPRKSFDRNLKMLVELSGGQDRFIKDILPEYLNRVRDNTYVSSTSSINRLLDDFPYRIPAYNREDMAKVMEMISDIGPRILGHFKSNRKNLISIFKSLRGNEFSSFSEFFYFYYHFVFAQVTNYLAEQGLFHLPEYSFGYWMQEEPIIHIDNMQQ